MKERTSRLRKTMAGLATLLAVIGMAQPTLACSRAVYLGLDGIVVTARSNDWWDSQGTHIWIYPRGIARTGNTGEDSLLWTSKYGSVTSGGWDVATIDGMNEVGLVANMLYLSESEYGEPAEGETRKGLTLAAWAQYVLDNFATVAETVAALEAEPFYIAAPMTPDGHAGTAHLSVSDPTGDSAVFEYLDGELVIHHGREFQVMTNSPPFDQQLALNAYWQNIGGLTMLPGTNRASDRFVRASFYVDAIPQTADTTEAIASAFGVIRNISVPIGISTPDQPDVAATQWRTVSDQKNRVYYFESARSPYIVWFPLDEIDFSEGAPTRRVELTEGSVLLVDGQPFAGNAAQLGEPTEPFTFLAAGN